ncbi:MULTISPECIES: hypothetical protein [Oceanobacillus]|uniref:Uncharacterized protein n=1 Tax=Oceanobacillus aidingensis TaxID=645964 RepID=A0ABV9JX95_9BACI|nr:hypothetical protein [Oceanobacillus oncorhynchi]MDM8099948.1 hypothetical protein [Oceanobacillus oncorhynchi]UUI40494.1 hypothetical protein NP440_02590 [Oceanobacillus oncorhynchi]
MKKLLLRRIVRKKMTQNPLMQITQLQLGREKTQTAKPLLTVT